MMLVNYIGLAKRKYQKQPKTLTFITKKPRVITIAL